MKHPSGNWKSRLTRFAGLALVAAALVFLTVQPVTNFIINHDAFRPWLTVEIARQSSGGTFRYSGITGSVFGMTLGDVEFTEGDPAANIRRARANRLHASFELLPLLRRELRLRSLELVDAEIVTRLDGTDAARIRLPVSRPHPAVLLDERAVGRDQGQTFVYLVDEQDTVVFRPVTLGPTHGGLRAVANGLQPGDRVVVNGLQRIRPGVKVEPREVAMGSGPAATPAPTSSNPAVPKPAAQSPAALKPPSEAGASATTPATTSPPPPTPPAPGEPRP